jgi:quinol monooxygenase YgiN
MRSPARIAGAEEDLLMIGTRYLILSCAIALSAIGCGSEEPSATEATEPEVAPTSGAETAAPAPAEPAATPAPAPEEPPPAAAVAPPPPEMPKSSAVVTFKVKDYAAFKTAFDGAEQTRKDSGALGHALSRDVVKGDTIQVWIPTADTAKIEASYATPETKKALKDAGVVGKVTVTPLAHAEMSPPTGGAMPKFGAIVDTKVKDYAAWKAIFDADKQVRTDAGVASYAISQNPKDPNHVMVWLEGDDKDKLDTYLKSKELKARNKEAGVKGAPKVAIYENVEMKMYPQ